MPSMLHTNTYHTLTEPTSGLDSASSITLMRCLKILAGLGTNIIATLHQPRKEILVSSDSYI